MWGDTDDLAGTADVPYARGRRSLRRVGRVLAADGLHPHVEEGHVGAEAFGQVGQLGLSVTQRTSDSGGTGNVRGRHERLDGGRAHDRRGRHGVELGMGLTDRSPARRF